MQVDKKQFAVFALGVFVIQAGINGVYPIVSSLNVDEGLGTTSFAIGYATALVSALLIPGLSQLAGVKKLFLVVQACYLPFVLGNMYSSYYSLVPAGFFLGVGESGFWPSISVIAAYFAKQYSTNENKKPDKTLSQFTGYVFTSVQAGAVFGNAISFLFLYADRSLSNRLYNLTNLDFSFCGSNDCQIENITSANLEQYTPAHPATRYALISFLAMSIVGAIILQSVTLPKHICVETAVQLEQSFVEEPNRLQRQDALDQLGDEHITPNVILMQVCQNDDGQNNHNEISGRIERNPTGESLNQVQCKGSMWKTFYLSLRSIAVLFRKTKQLFVMLMPIYDGMLISFIYGEMTRSFASCVLGVDKLGKLQGDLEEIHHLCSLIFLI